MSHEPGFLTAGMRAFPGTRVPALAAVTCASARICWAWRINGPRRTMNRVGAGTGALGL